MDEELKKLYKAVDDFAAKMKEKLKFKHVQGYKGWNKKSYKKGIEDSLIRHVIDQIHDAAGHKRYQEVDIANLAMMLYFINKEKK